MPVRLYTHNLIARNKYIFIAATVVFYALGFSCCSCFMNLARRWPRLEELWQRTEHEQIQYGYPKNLHLRIRVISTVTLAIALGE